jgi:hypothetical protein
MILGVNFQAFKCACYQNRLLPAPPINYINDSFKIFSESGLNCVRIPIYWESYELDKEAFKEELDNISNAADRNNILCIYDNHQWKCSSFLGYGIGFPNSILSLYFNKDNKQGNPLNKPNDKDIKKFWNGWWDRKFMTEDKKEGWDSQLEYFKTIIKRVRDKKSTWAFEILNEPQVYRQKDFEKVGEYHNFFLNLENITDKKIFFCYTSSGSIFNAINFPWEQAKIKPSVNIKNDVIFDIHPYPPCNLLLIYYKLILRIFKKYPLFVGEFNFGIGIEAKISLKQIKHYLKRLQKHSIPGGLFWQWSYIEDNQHPSFNLTKIVEKKIYPNENFRNYINAINEHSNEDLHN